MKKLAVVALALVLLPSYAAARVINVEFEFTPYVGDPAKTKTVKTVPGKARVYVNEIPVAEQDVERQDAMVLFDDHEVAPAVWVQAKSLGSVVRKGANTIRIEFEPSDAKAAYRADLRWASVTDQTTTTGDASHGTETNQAGEGVESKQGKGRIVFERQFDAPFAIAQPWHRLPAVTELSDDDKKKIGNLVRFRVAAFRPDFAAFYTLLKERPEIDVEGVRSSKCIEKAWDAGLRMQANSDDLQMTTTKSAAVVVQPRNGPLYKPTDPSAIGKLVGDDMQMCASMALSVAYPPRLVVVRTDIGTWSIVP